MCVCCQAKATRQEQEISRLMSDVSRLEDVRTSHETSIRHLQDTVEQTSDDHGRRHDQATHTIHALTGELRTTKQALEDVTKRERQVLAATTLAHCILVNPGQLVPPRLSGTCFLQT